MAQRLTPNAKRAHDAIKDQRFKRADNAGDYGRGFNAAIDTALEFIRAADLGLVYDPDMDVWLPPSESD